MMDNVLDGSSDKRRILSELSRCLKRVFIETSNSNSSPLQINISSPLIQCIDHSLQHGLLNLLHGYWPLVRSLSHTQTLQTIDGWVGSQGSTRAKGQAWLLATLVEGSLLSYLHCLFSEPQTISRFYASHAILRDPACVSQLSSLLVGMESINFTVERAVNFDWSTFSGIEEKASINLRPLLDLPLNGSNGLPSVGMTSSVTSSLASPGDSGFTQLDSETDTASFSEVVLDADCASIKEEVAVLPVDPCVEKIIGMTSMCEPMTVSDIANANTSTDLLDDKSDLQNATESALNWHTTDDTDEIVHRRPKGKTGKTIVKQQKRVSFHECTSDLPPNDTNSEGNNLSKETAGLSISFRESASNLSRAVGDLSSFNCEQEGVEIGKDSSLLGNEGIEELSDRKLYNSSISSDSLLVEENCAKSMKYPKLGDINKHIVQKRPVTERGIPEGQEDPPHRCSISTSISDQLSISAIEKIRMSNNFSPAPSCSSLRPHVSTPRRALNGPNSSTLSNLCATSVLSQTPSKACLVNRFLRSITEKKLFNSRSAAALVAFNKKNSSMRKLNLYIHNVKAVDELSEQLLDELKEELNVVIYDSTPREPSIHHHLIDISPTLNDYLQNHLELSSSETMCKVLKVRGTSVDAHGRRVPLLAIITDKALYIVDQKMKKTSVLLHSELSSVLVGPNYQWISLSSSENAFQLNLLTGERDCVSDLIGSIELALRRKRWNPSSLPSVVHLFYQEFFKVSQWNSLLKGENVHHFSVVHALEETSSSSRLSSGAHMKAYFMYKTYGENTSSSWEPGFFVLKNGVLFISSDEDIAPQHILHLQGVKCHFISLPSRPHTIEIGHVHIAAPDDYVAQDWLCALEKSAFAVHESTILNDQSTVISGSLILTETRLMLIRSLGIPHEDLDNLSKPLLTAFVSDVTSVRVGDSNSCWCNVEFACREVHEAGGDYVIFFSTFYEMQDFKESLWKLSPLLEQNSCVIDNTEALHRRCKAFVVNLTSDWNFFDPLNL